MSTLQHATEHDPSALRPTSDQSIDPPVVERVIRPSRGWIGIDWLELYHSRELFDTLVLRDIKIRYKQTVFGVAWAIVQPLVNIITFTLIFGSIPGLRPDGVPYPLFLLAGTVPWGFFSSAVGAAGSSLFGSQHLLTKIYFPRLYIPASTVGTQLVDMMIGLMLFSVLFPIFGYRPSINLIFLPLIIFLTCCAALGLGLIMAAVTLLFRDLRFVVPFVMQMLMFASPILYSPSALPPKVQLLISFNPVTGIISAYRWSILGMPMDWLGLGLSVVMTAVVLVLGLFLFRKTERYFADLL